MAIFSKPLFSMKEVWILFGKSSMDDVPNWQKTLSGLGLTCSIFMVVYHYATTNVSVTWLEGGHISCL